MKTVFTLSSARLGNESEDTLQVRSEPFNHRVRFELNFISSFSDSPSKPIGITYFLTQDEAAALAAVLTAASQDKGYRP